MQFRAEQYYTVSLQRMNQAHALYREGDAFSLTMYCAGLAVESLLRAFRWTEDSSFEGRHVLSELLTASRLFRLDEEYLRRKKTPEEAIHDSAESLQTAMNVVIVLWHNNLRFASEATLKTFLVKINRVQGVKGDPLKKKA